MQIYQFIAGGDFQIGALDSKSRIAPVTRDESLLRALVARVGVARERLARAVVRRREARIRFNEGLLQDLVDLQRQIAADAIATLATNAHILYITCSLEPQENEAMPRWLAKWHGHELIHEAASLPAGLPGEPANCYRDGGYVALLRT